MLCFCDGRHKFMADQQVFENQIYSVRINCRNAPIASRCAVPIRYIGVGEKIFLTAESARLMAVA